MRFAKNSNFHSTSDRHAAPNELMKTKVLDATGFPVNDKDKISILFEDQLIVVFIEALELLFTSLSYVLCKFVSFSVLSTYSLYSLLHSRYVSINTGRCFSGPWIPCLFTEIFQDFSF